MVEISPDGRNVADGTALLPASKAHALPHSPGALLPITQAERKDVRFLAAMPEGASWIVYGDCLIIADPDHLPRVIRPDGTEVKLIIGGDT